MCASTLWYCTVQSRHGAILSHSARLSKVAPSVPPVTVARLCGHCRQQTIQKSPLFPMDIDFDVLKPLRGLNMRVVAVEMRCEDTSKTKAPGSGALTSLLEIIRQTPSPVPRRNLIALSLQLVNGDKFSRGCRVCASTSISRRTFRRTNCKRELNLNTPGHPSPARPNWLAHVMA